MIVIDKTHPNCACEDYYNVIEVKDTDAMALLRSIFPDADASGLNFCLFSTSGVHGTYRTIEEEESKPGTGVTFLIIRPRLVLMQYGVVMPETPEDFQFLKDLRQSSKKAVMDEIG